MPSGKMVLMEMEIMMMVVMISGGRRWDLVTKGTSINLISATWPAKKFVELEIFRSVLDFWNYKMRKMCLAL